MNIFLAGNRGVIGQVVQSKLENLGHKVYGSCRPGKTAPNSVEISPWLPIKTEYKFDVVIHLAGKYQNHPDMQVQHDVFDSNIGLTSSISAYCSQTATPLVFTGSFFEMAPSEMQPWSYYTLAKKYSSELIKLATDDKKFKSCKLYLYDNYGENLTRGKFVDLLLLNNESNKDKLKLSEGKQVQNLTSINDVAKAVILAALNVESQELHETIFQVKSHETLSLKEIAEAIESASNKPLNIEWGALPYRSKEVFNIWDSASDLPGWHPEFYFGDFLKDYFSRKSRHV